MAKGGGSWEFNKKLPEYWTIDYKDLTFKVSPTNFKHTGIFPEQAVNWDWMMDVISKETREIRILNLFGYTGCGSMACSLAGAKEVVHVDASKGILNWAKENMELCNLSNNTIRFINDDAREVEVLKEIAKGLSNQEIGDTLFISLKTVKTHVSNILAKLQVEDRTQAAIYAIKHKIA